MRYTRIELDPPTEMNIMHAFRTEQVVLLPPGTAGGPHGQVVGPSPDRPGELTVMTGSGDPIMIDVSPEQPRYTHLRLAATPVVAVWSKFTCALISLVLALRNEESAPGWWGAFHTVTNVCY